MFLRILLIFIILLISFEAKSEIIIENFQKETFIEKYSKKITIKFQARVQNLPRNTFHSNFTTKFKFDSKVKVQDVLFNNKPANYLFKNNGLVIKFDEGKINNEKFQIQYSYIINNLDANQYLRQEFISSPPWVKGAKTKISLHIPNNLEIISLNKKVKKTANKLIYQGITPIGGFKELIKLTPKSTIWNVQIKKQVRAKTNLIELKTQIPVYFNNGGQKIVNYQTISTPDSIAATKSSDEYTLRYKNISNKEIDILVNALVYTGKNNKTPILRDPKKYLKVEKNDWLNLSSTLNTIKNDPELKNLPLYAKIGEYVNNYIEYDRKYIGKLLDNSTILSLKKGVCTEYAQLYNTLARMAGIPSTIINGIARGEYNKFEGHSWNMIYIDNKWQQVDPTWNLMSGEVSSSHIYFYDNGQKSIQASWKSKKGSPENNIALNTQFKAIEVTTNNPSYAKFHP